MKPLLLGANAVGEPIRLAADDREAHMHVIGSSGSGKSKFLEWMIRQDIRNRQGFCLIDPHGTLYRDVVNHCAHWVMDREIVLLNLSQPDRVIGFNPFRRNEQGDISVQVDRRISATMHAWGVENADETPTLERTLRLIYTILVEKNLSFEHARHLIDFSAHELREDLIKGISSALIRREWQELQELKPKDWRSEVLSAKNRLFRLLSSKTLCRFLSSCAHPLDLASVIEEGKILLVNLAPSDHLSAENARVFGALLVNEFFEVARRRIPEPGRDLKPFCLYLDEFQTFVSLDITAMLDQVRKYRLFTVLAHQRFGQLDDDLSDAVLTNCRIKAVFGGLPYETAKMMAQELFIRELDPKKIKVAVFQTKFWPKYARDKVYTTSSSSGHSLGRGDNLALGASLGSVSAEFFKPGDWFGVDLPAGTSITEANTESKVSGEHSSETDFTGDAEGEADVPIMLPVPFSELSSIQFYSQEEQLMELIASLKEGFDRHCFIKIHHQKTQPMRVPFVSSPFTPQENLDWYTGEILKKTNAMEASEVDAAMAKQEEELRSRVRPTSAKAASAAESREGQHWSDILGRE